ncbi:MAG: transposase [Rhizobiaceae bacterium]
MRTIREQLVNQRTELVNALRGYPYESGYVAPQGIGYLRRLAEVIEDEKSELPDLAREICSDLLDQIHQLTARIDTLGKKMMHWFSRVKSLGAYYRPCPVSDPSLPLRGNLAPPMESFKRGRDFAAWLGLVPLQKSTGGKPRLGRSRRWGSAIFGGYSSSAPWPWCNGHPGKDARRLLARPHDREEATHAGGDRAGQQDGACHLGHAN